LVNTDAGGIVYCRGFYIGYAWSIFSIPDLAKMLVIMSGMPGTLKGYLLAALLQVKILIAPTIIILLLSRAVLDLVVCVTAIEAKVVNLLVSSNFLFQSISIKKRVLSLVGL
jgi:hypothetical protein